MTRGAVLVAIPMAVGFSCCLPSKGSSIKAATYETELTYCVQISKTEADADECLNSVAKRYGRPALVQKDGGL